MKVIDRINDAKGPFVSFEIIPPLRGKGIKDLLDLVDNLVKFNPPFIDVTSHSAEIIYEESDTEIRKRVRKKRPGTGGACVAILYKHKIDPVVHVLCNGFTREETEDFLIDLNYLGIENIFAVRGDGAKKDHGSDRSINRYSVDLVSQISDMNRGCYLEQDLLDAKPTDFCIGVAGYPEKHFESPNLQTDIIHLKEKVDAGAKYVVTQMFFDNSKYFNYVQTCRLAGINVPIIPGIKILSSKKQLASIPSNFYIDIPYELSNALSKVPDDQVSSVGIEWAAKQVGELLGNKVPGIHFYIMQEHKAVQEVLKKVSW